MENKILPVQFKEIKHNIYAGFLSRLAAAVLDFIIWLPIFFFFDYFLIGLTRFFYFFTILPYLFIVFIFQIYLVKRFGGSPGKLIVGIKIIKKDGEDADWNAAVKRYIISFVITILGICWMMNAILIINDDVFIGFHQWDRLQYLAQISPDFYNAKFGISNIWVYILISYTWLYSELVFLFTNQRKRSIQDFMAGTVVIKTKFLKRIKDIQKNKV